MPNVTAACIQDWVTRTDRAVADLMPLHAPLADLPGIHQHKRALMLLSTACLGSTGTVLYLVESMRLWDAELIMRAVAEGTVKFGYLLESSATYPSRCIEYTDALLAISLLRRHARAVEALRALAGTEDANAKPFCDLLLAEKEVADIRAIYPREMRRDIERRWGFTALVDAVSKQGGVFGPAARILLHGYSVASDLQHMSHVGTELSLERDMRSEHRHEAIELAHAARLLGDCFHFTSLRVLVLLRFLEHRWDQLLEVEAKHVPLMKELKQAGREWEAMEYPISPATTG